MGAAKDDGDPSYTWVTGMIRNYQCAVPCVVVDSIHKWELPKIMEDPSITQVTGIIHIYLCAVGGG